VNHTLRPLGKRAARIAVAALLMGAMAVSLVGCSEKTEMSKEEQENFKGGPMPPGFLDKPGGAPSAGPGNAPASGASPQARPPSAAPK
jgi:hypothetical protein